MSDSTLSEDLLTSILSGIVLKRPRYRFNALGSGRRQRQDRRGCVRPRMRKCKIPRVMKQYDPVHVEVGTLRRLFAEETLRLGLVAAAAAAAPVMEVKLVGVDVDSVTVAAPIALQYNLSKVGNPGQDEVLHTYTSVSALESVPEDDEMTQLE